MAKAAPPLATSLAEALWASLNEEQAMQIAALPQESFDEIFDALEDGVLGSVAILALVPPQE